jgi:hypothetical protein
MAQPKTFQELVQEISAGPKADADNPKSLINALKGVVRRLILNVFANITRR